MVSRWAKSIVVGTGILIIGVLGVRENWGGEQAFAQPAGTATPARIVGNSIVVESDGPIYAVVVRLRPGTKGPTDSQSSLTIDREIVEQLVVHRATPVQLCDEKCRPCLPATCDYPPPPPPPGTVAFQSGQIFLRWVWRGKP
jgi:hypothetical protein